VLSRVILLCKTSVANPDPHQIKREEPDPHHSDKLDPDPDPQQSDKLDTDSHQLAADKPK
jgi:hypothetical protein